MLKIAYVGLRWNYAKREEGNSFEYDHLEQGLKDCVNDGMFQAEYFHPDEPEELEKLRYSINNFDGVIHAEFDATHDLPDDIAKLFLLQDKFCVVWSSDSSWRFDDWILPRKYKYSHFTTTHNLTIPFYEQNKMKVIKSQWFVNSLYGPRNIEEQYDVVFLGQKYGQREQIMNFLIQNGVNLAVAGNYWENCSYWKGYITNFEQSLDFMSSGKININLSMPFHGGIPQLKARFVQIPGLQKLQIMTPADNIEEYFVPDQEIVIVKNTNELLEKIRFYLQNDNERLKIANAGYQRIIKEHTAQHRFKEILFQL